MKAKRFEEGRVYEYAHVPADYQPLRSLEATEATLRRFIADLCQRGEVRRIRCKKRMFVHQDDIISARCVLANRRHKNESNDDHPGLFVNGLHKPQVLTAADAGIDKSHAESACLSLADIGSTMVEIRCVLERLTAAVESIATQPKDTEQMVRNEIMAAVGSNGFHN